MVTSDGVSLVYDIVTSSSTRGSDDLGAQRKTVLFFHGGGQTRHAWSTVAHAVAAAGYDAWTVDLRGHGDSGRAPTGAYALGDFVEDVAAVIAAAPPRAILVGASLGGGAALGCCASRDVDVAGLVLVDIGMRLQNAGIERIIGFMREHTDGFASLEDAAAAIAAYAPRAGKSIRPEGLKKNLRRDDAGRYRWHWDPALLDAFDIVDDMMRNERVSAALRTIAVKQIPFAVIRGGSSDVIDDDAAAETARLGNGRVIRVADASHMVAGDANDAFSGALLDALSGFH